MKTVISLPDDLFAQADAFAERAGMSRSKLYATALREYILSRQQGGLTERINAACAELDTSLPKDIAQLTRQKLLEIEW